jgi:hypothetical protein
MNISNVLTSVLTSSAKEAFAKKLGVDSAKADALLTQLTPLLTTQLAKNASTKDGAAALLAALQKDHDGSILDTLSEQTLDAREVDGQKIIQHIFKNKADVLGDTIATATGDNKDTITKALSVLAPIVMGSLGKVQKEQGFGVDDIAQVLQTMTSHQGSEASSTVQGLLTDLLDSNNDGSAKDDVLRMGFNALQRFFKK